MSASALQAVPPKTALVTGATSGIGWETARLLAERGRVVIVHGPDTESAHHAVERLVAAGADRARLRLAVADFRRLSQVKRMAADLSAHHPVLDVLVNNAAVAAPEEHTLTEDGNELAFQVNFLAAYLLTRELRGPLTARPGSRVVNVSSITYRTASLDWDDLNRAHRYSRYAAYAQSQLALTVFAGAAAPAGCTVVSVDPGTGATALLPVYVHEGEGESPAEGAARVVRLCDPRTPLVPGAHYDTTGPSTAGHGERTARRLCKAADRLVTV
ncbi:SDR family NAD(P)-dependent oxidoreductase [Streptomyces sp. NPDC058691]|uniref:SDR family NAD(P)-dependent oxidoreductase n=1 Tax=Streptomyces sp. NPDC058691 TaxID=3346601 RepID=UPI00364A1B1D